MKEYLKKIETKKYLQGLLNWDMQTKGKTQTNELMQPISTKLSLEISNMYKDEQFRNEVLEAQKANPNSRECEKLLEHIDKTLKLDDEHITKFNDAVFNANKKWLEAREANDFNVYIDALTEMISITKERALLINPDQNPFDTLLSEYEEGFTRVEYDKIFKVIEEKLVPLVKDVLKSKSSIERLEDNDCLDEQKSIKNWIAEIMEFDFTRGEIAESVHPFCMGLNVDDVRLTTAYKDDPISSVNSLFYELGHARYEQGISRDLSGSFLNHACSLSIHESQSRFYEQFVFSNKTFINQHFDKIKSYISLYKDMDADEFYKYVNDVEASYIRVEADELTYPLHILLRYKIEYELLNDVIEVKDAGKRWNELYYEYFGVEVDSDVNGVLQDVHWSYGLIGYFPTYLFGTSIAAQLYATMNKEFNIEDSFKTGNLTKVHEWLNKQIHVKGATKKQLDLIAEVCGEPYSPQYYIDYLVKKYSDLYL